MKRSSSAEKPRIKKLKIIKNIDDILKRSKNNIVLFGPVGNGKTSLLNKLTGKSFEVADRGYSCTRSIQYYYSIIYDMVIIDFPGLNATKNIVEHLINQINTLSTIPIKMLCFVIKYTNRYDNMENEVSQMLEIFEDLIENITIIITHSENVKDTEKETIKYIIKEQFQIENIIFTEIVSNAYRLCEQLDILQKTMENIPQIAVRTKNLIKNIPNVFDRSLSKERPPFKETFDLALKLFEKELEKAKDNNDLKLAIFFCFKDFKCNLIEAYSKYLVEKKIDGKEYDINKIVLEVLKFSNVIFNDYENIRKKVESQIEVKLNNYNGEYNKFKKCPHCGQIWFKIKGCDTMQCGQRTNIRDKFFGRFKHYIVKLVNNIISIENPKEQGDNISENDYEFIGLTRKEKEENIEREKKGKKLISPVGCGNYLNWNKMEDCTKEVIEKLKNECLDDDYYSKYVEMTNNLSE